MTNPIEPNASTEEETAFLLEYLRDRDVPCPLCRQNLRNQISPQCPNCARQLKLSMSMAASYLPVWIVLMAATTASAGIGLFMLAICLAIGQIPDKVKTLCFGFWPMIPLPILAFIFRREFLRASRMTQRVLALSAWALFIIVLVANVIYIYK